jgi:hypothetical protein
MPLDTGKTWQATVHVGFHPTSPQIGRHTGTGTGAGKSRGAGPGLTISPGVSPPVTMAAGCIGAMDGHGHRALLPSGPVMLPRWLLSSEAAIGVFHLHRAAAR